MSANVVPEVLKGSRMSEETVEALSSFKDEPGWLTEKRLGAWRAFEALPMPTLHGHLGRKPGGLQPLYPESRRVERG
jgi:hypothetical protein